MPNYARAGSTARESSDRPKSGMPGSRLYYIHPLLAGRMDGWAPLLDRIGAMRFDAVAVAPPFVAGQDGDLFATADYGRLDGRLGGGDALAALAKFAATCRSRGLRPALDVVVDRVSPHGIAQTTSTRSLTRESGRRSRVWRTWCPGPI